MSSSSVVLLSKCIVYPDKISSIKPLKLSASDLPWLPLHYIQKGILLSYPPHYYASSELIDHLKLSLSKALSYFPPLSGRLETDQQGHIHIICNDSGVGFFHAEAPHLHADAILRKDRDIPACFREFFQFDYTANYAGHHKPLLAVQITELNDAVFIGLMANHALVDGVSFWNFFNTFAQISRGYDNEIRKLPDFGRETVFDSLATLKVNAGLLSTTTYDYNNKPALREKIFHFSKEAILKIKYRANNYNTARSSGQNNKIKPMSEISSFQSFCALIWRSITRARNLKESETTTFKMAVNCRHRVEPKMAPFYFGNAVQILPVVASVGDLLSNDLDFSGGLLHRSVAECDAAAVVRSVKEWEENPMAHHYPVGNSGGKMIFIAGSPRSPIYEIDFGWGRPLAVRTGRANKFDGKISANPAREGDGSVDLEVALAPQTMAAFELDMDCLQYVS